MRGHNVHFDVEHSRIGMAESDCDYEYLATGKRSESLDPYLSAAQIRELFAREVLGFKFDLFQIIFVLTVILSVMILFHFLIVLRIFQENAEKDDSATSIACPITWSAV